jgi:prepilin-type N-terminal cleavage/methylation domain-containing protein
MVRSKTNKGFTLVEMLITFAIIGILATIVISSTTASRGRARDTRRIGDLKEIQLALAVYYDVNKSFPVSLATLVTEKYLPVIPADPTGASYEYNRVTTTTYCLGATLEVPSGSPGDGTSCVTGGTANYKVQQPK